MTRTFSSAMCRSSSMSPYNGGSAVLRVAAEGADQRLQFVDRRADPLPIGAADDQGDAEIAAPEIRVGADLEIRVAGLQLAQILGDRTFGQGAADAAAQHGRAALQ